MSNSNFFICRNEVFIEGESVGEFESFSMKAQKETFGATAVMTLPLYGIGITPFDGASQQSTVSEGRANRRVRSNITFSNIKVCATVKVVCWYEQVTPTERRTLDKITVFDGFIEHIAEGFPTKFYLRDGSFMMRFGKIENVWTGDKKLSEVVTDCIAIAKKAFEAERKEQKLTAPVPELRYTQSTKHTKGEAAPLSFDNFAVGRSPFEVMQYLMQLLYMYAGVDSEGNVFIGTGVSDSEAEIKKLSTRYNVINREIVTRDNRFVDYDVKVTGIIKGKRYTATAGFLNSKSVANKNPFGEQIRRNVGSNFKSFDEIQNFANEILKTLQGDFNKGTLTLLLYPKCELLDTVKYDDTVFDIYDTEKKDKERLYYIQGYSFVANDKGYYQKLEVTDRVYML